MNPIKSKLYLNQIYINKGIKQKINIRNYQETETE